MTEYRARVWELRAELGLWRGLCGAPAATERAQAC